MSQLLRYPPIWIGVVLLALGGGNWINGEAKLAEYDAMVAYDAAHPTDGSYDGYRHLTARTSASLLRPLRPRASTRSIAEGKLEFYHVVVTGGRLLTLIGWLVLVVGVLWQRRQARRGLVGSDR